MMDLTLELYTILEIKIIPMLLFLHLRPIFMISLQILLVDLSLLSKSFIPTCMIHHHRCYLQGEGWCNDLIVLLLPPETLSGKLLLF